MNITLTDTGKNFLHGVYNASDPMSEDEIHLAEILVWMVDKHLIDYSSRDIRLCYFLSILQSKNYIQIAPTSLLEESELYLLQDTLK